MIYLMVKSGLVAPGKHDGYYMVLFWDNIISLTSNLLNRSMTIIIDYVIFEEQIKNYRF